MTGDKARMSFMLEVFCVDCPTPHIPETHPQMELDDDIEGNKEVEFKCPDCGKKINIYYSVRNN